MLPLLNHIRSLNPPCGRNSVNKAHLILLDVDACLPYMEHKGHDHHSWGFISAAAALEIEIKHHQHHTVGKMTTSYSVNSCKNNKY